MRADPDMVAWTLAHEYNFVPLDETMYEYWEDVDKTNAWYWEKEDIYDVVRIANTPHCSRAHFLIDRTGFE